MLPLEELGRENASAAELSSSEGRVWSAQQRPVQASDGSCGWVDGGATGPGLVVPREYVAVVAQQR